MKKIKLYWRFCRRKFKTWWKKNPPINSLILGIYALGLFLLIIMFLTCEGGIFAWLLGTGTKKETIEFIAFGIGGLLAVIGAVALDHRASAQIEHNKLIEKGHVDERFKAAIQNLGNKEASVRIASFHQFCYLAENQPEDFRESVFDILCAYLRAMPRDRSHLTEKKEKHPTEECETLLDILLDTDDKHIFAKFTANMNNSYLVNTKFVDKNLSNAGLWKANLSEAALVRTNLSRARLLDANLSDAMFRDVNLSGANLWDANLSSALLEDVNLSGAKLFGADLSSVFFDDVDLSNANLQKTQLKNADLIKVRSIKNADFRGAKIGDRPITKDDLPADKGEYYADWNPPPEKEEN